MTQPKDLNRYEDFAQGLILGLTFWWNFGWLAGVLGLVCGTLWLLGGKYGHSWKVYGIPSAIAICCLIFNYPWWTFIGLPLTGAVFSIGYGIPDCTDEGSALGRFWFKIWKGNVLLTNIFTRGTIYVLLAITFIPIWLLA